MFVDTVLQWISQYGYVAIFFLLVLGIVGLPVPDETLLTFTGVLISRGRFSFLPAFLAALLGSGCGITISFWLGRIFGLKVLHKYGKYVHFTEDRLNKVHWWFERIGKWALTFGYFIPGVRHFTAYVAGSAELESHVFAVFAYSGAFIWVSTFISLGYFFGEHWQTILEMVHRNLIEATVVAAVLIAAYAAWRWWRKRTLRRTGGTPPRA
jgi:membrane protein DedA with SNARE-associated domain